ncbi:MAG TPA: SH3 domain-containing protein, partial [Pyrinomonadaceae bacterium]|nr:SH3 domain-containing protein [Pyrinomonadaceae bacterium]
MKYIKTFLFIVSALILQVGCSSIIAKINETGVVIARRAQVRSSTAVVAADLVEVSRGDVVDILDTSTVPETGERWLRVRAHDVENTEGWIEARNVMAQDVLERARQLAEEDKPIPAQAAGQLRASTNLR